MCSSLIINEVQAFVSFSSSAKHLSMTLPHLPNPSFVFFLTITIKKKSFWLILLFSHVLQVIFTPPPFILWYLLMNFFGGSSLMNSQSEIFSCFLLGMEMGSNCSGLVPYSPRFSISISVGCHSSLSIASTLSCFHLRCFRTLHLLIFQHPSRLGPLNLHRTDLWYVTGSCEM